MRRMRWNCDNQGCFNVKKRIKLGEFDECFPRGAGMGDVDGVVEIGGHFLLHEWKDPSLLPNGWETKDMRQRASGQTYMFNRMAKDDKWTVVVIYGDAETMEIVAIEVFAKGTHHRIIKCDLAKLKARCKRWADKVDSF